MSSVGEKEFRWTVFGIIWSLLKSDRRDIPDMDPTVRTCRGEYGLMRGRPSEREDFVCMLLEGMEAEGEVTSVPKTNCL